MVAVATNIAKSKVGFWAIYWKTAVIVSAQFAGLDRTPEQIEVNKIFKTNVPTWRNRSVN